MTIISKASKTFACAECPYKGFSSFNLNLHVVRSHKRSRPAADPVKGPPDHGDNVHNETANGFEHPRTTGGKETPKEVYNLANSPNYHTPDHNESHATTVDHKKGSDDHKTPKDDESRGPSDHSDSEDVAENSGETAGTNPSIKKAAAAATFEDYLRFSLGASPTQEAKPEQEGPIPARALSMCESLAPPKVIATKTTEDALCAGRGKIPSPTSKPKQDTPRRRPKKKADRPAQGKKMPRAKQQQQVAKDAAPSDARSARMEGRVRKPFGCALCPFTADCNSRVMSHREAVHEGLKKHECHVCGKKFGYPHSLKNHVRIFHKGVTVPPRPAAKVPKAAFHLARKTSTIQNPLKRVKCSFCFYRSRDSDVMKEHVEASHKNVKIHKCRICDKTFAFLSSMRHHMRTVHVDQSKLHSCTLCKFKSTQRFYLQAHVEAVHQKLRKHSCSICEKTFGYLNNMTMHVKIVHEKLGKECPRCPGLLLLNLERHCLRTHGEPATLLPKDSVQASSEDSVQTATSVKNASVVLQKQQVKKVVPKEVSQALKLGTLAHSKAAAMTSARISGKYKYQCTLCPYKTHDRTYVKAHTEVVHEKLRKHKCHACDKTFGFLSNMKIHVMVVHDKVAKRCPMCRLFFLNLDKHLLRKHNGVTPKPKLRQNKAASKRPQKVSRNWGKNYSLKTALSAKQTKHECEDCGKRFGHSSALANHVKLFHQVHRLRCPKCPGKFYILELEHHLFQRHGDRKLKLSLKKISDNPKAGLNGVNSVQGQKGEEVQQKKCFECKICNKSYGYSRSLAAHAKKVHKGLAKDQFSNSQGLDADETKTVSADSPSMEDCASADRFSNEKNRSAIEEKVPEQEGTDSLGKEDQTQIIDHPHEDSEEKSANEIYASMESDHPEKNKLPVDCSTEVTANKAIEDCTNLTTARSMPNAEGAHDPPKKHQCQECGKAMGYFRSLQRHMRRTHKSKRLPGKQRFRNLEAHLLKQHGIDKEGETSLTNLKEPLKHQCQECGKTMGHLTSLKRHMKQTHKRRRLVCPKCPGKQRFRNLEAHLLKQHGIDNEGETSRTNVIKTISPPKEQLLEAVQVDCISVDGEPSAVRKSDWVARLFKCEKCDKSFALNDNLQDHVYSSHKAEDKNESHSIDDEKAGKQESCTIKYTNKVSKVKREDQPSEDERCYLCHLCPGEFATEGGLDSHMRGAHRAEVTYKCVECERKFWSSMALLKHFKAYHC